MRPTLVRAMCALGLLAAGLATPAAASALDLVVDGKPRATIVVEPAAGPAQGRPVRGGGRRQNAPGDAMAAQVLSDWVKKITGAELPIAAAAPADGPAIYVGRAAVRAGLALDGIDSPTHEGLRVVCDGRRVLLAGQDGASTVKAACRLLEELGCRYYMDSPLGEVYPHAATLAVKEMDLREKPGLAVRQIWGSNWSGQTLWKIWNGAGGLQLTQGHAWGKYVPKELFDTHPEYFALRNGERKRGDWYCTANPGLRQVFAEGVIRSLAEGGGNASISPPDGTGYCECDACRAQDDPDSIEPSSGRVSVTDRYVDFFNDVARRVRAKHPDAKLSFYCYADYTQAPTRGLKLEPNLVAWVAPLRYCRLHAIGSPVCPSRQQLQEMLDGWSRAAEGSGGIGGIGYRTYNYNLAECLVPFSMLSVWGHDVPYLKQHGAIGINLETLPSWQIYGPHIYLSIRLAYDPAADATRVMDDYFQNFYGPAAGPIMERYWLGVDRRFADLHAHAGGFYAVHRVYTPEFLAHCRDLLDKAADAARVDPAYAARVAMHAEGFENAAQYAQVRDALNAGRPQQAVEAYHRLLARAEAQTRAGYGSRYTPDYLKRFVGGQVEAAAAAAESGRVALVLPDRWRLAYDGQDQGLARGYARVEFDDSAWQTVATYGDTLDAQGLPDRKTVMWYRTTIDVPALTGKPSLLFIDVDGSATVYVNGTEAGKSVKKRSPFAVDAAGLRPGRNTVAVRVDHSSITELFLGGITRPVYLIDNGGR